MSLRRSSLAMPGAAPQDRLKKQLTRADRLNEDGYPERALEILLELDQKHPDRWEVLHRLADAYYQLEDVDGHLEVVERMLRLRPKDPDLLFFLSAAYLMAGLPLSAYETGELALSLKPDHPTAETVRGMNAELMQELKEIWQEQGLDPEQDAEIIRLHERHNYDLLTGRFAQAVEHGEKLLQLRPEFVPALNNQATALFYLDRWPEALSMQRNALELEPDNFLALASMVEFLVRSGDPVGAREYGERLRQVPATEPSFFVRKAEAFAYLEDPDEILRVLDAARKEGLLGSEEDALLAARLLHLAAVARLWQGEEPEARKLWKEALKKDPNYDLAVLNLADLQNPPEERHAPWPLPIQRWLNQSAAQALLQAFDLAGDHVAREKLRRVLEELMSGHPELVTALPLLLHYGEPESRQLAFTLIRDTRLPQWLPVLREYALSTHGPDYLRYEAAGIAIRAGVLEREVPMRFWRKGAWQEIRVLPYEITDEPTALLPSGVERLLEQAQTALAGGGGKEAEALIRRALAKHGEFPILHQNLAVALQAQGRFPEAREQLRVIRERFPDYFFGQLLAAQMALLEDEDADEAERLLAPLAQREVLHAAELRALCQLEIMLVLHRGNPDAAEPWLLAWEIEYPDDTAHEAWRGRMDAERNQSQPSALGRLKEFTASLLHRRHPAEE